MLSKENYDNLGLMSKEELIVFIDKMVQKGVSLSFTGKRNAQFIEKEVKPRQIEVDSDLSYGTNQGRSNILIEGENLQAMVTLYKYRGGIDLILTDIKTPRLIQFNYSSADFAA
ncbi:MAG: hypothetical protein U0M25_08935 [Oscillospiraceae bacterium]|nr:hypothetical protein [Oscillospiraceae bacterium]